MWPCTPLTVSVPDSEPRRPFLIMSPSALDRRRLADDAVVDRSPRAASRSTTRTVPSIDGPSSSDVSSSAIEPRRIGMRGDESLDGGDERRERALHVGRAAAVEPAVALGRRERIGCAIASSGPVGTTSVCPAKQTSGRAVPRRAHRLVTPLATQRLAAEAERLEPRARSAPGSRASSGVSERRAISARASSSVARAGCGRPCPCARCVGVARMSRRRCARTARSPRFSACGRASPVRCQPVKSLAGRRGAPLRLALRHRIDARRRRVLVDEPREVGRRVGGGHRLVVADLAVEIEAAQRLLERLRSGVERLLHRFLDLRDLAVLDELGDQRRVEQDLDGRLLAAVAVADEPLADDGAQADRQVGQQARARVVAGTC